MGRPLWFKAKRYGWGWYPCTWQGWAVLAFFVGITVYSYLMIARAAPSEADLAAAFVPVAALNVALLLAVCVLTGEKPRWRWGK